MALTALRPLSPGASGLRLEQAFRPAKPDSPTAADGTRKISAEQWAVLRSELHAAVLDYFQVHDSASHSAESVAAIADQHVDPVLANHEAAFSQKLRGQLIQDVVDEVVGFGPLQSLLDDPTINEVMVNGPRQVYIERRGQMELSDRIFLDDAHVQRIIERIVAPLGRRIDEGSPLVDARLPDGSRVNAVIPPICLQGPSITIRKFSKKPLTVQTLASYGSLTQPMADFLQGCVEARLNILVSGGTGSGKTTTLNALSGFIPHRERIVTIEDAAELQLQQPHIVSLETRPANLEGKGEISIRTLVKNSLRMRPERIVVGECRGGEALDMLQAMNTGHDGSMSTLHANTPRDTIARLETLVLMSGTELPARAIREQIAAAVHLIVQQARLQDGSRRITHITEVQGMEGENVVLQDIFVFKQHGISSEGKVIGEHVCTGLRPRCLETLQHHGVDINALLAQMKPGGNW